MDKTISWLVGIIVILGLGYWALTATPENKSPSDTNSSELKGTIDVSFTDATAEMKNISEVSMKVDKVELYSATRGWVTVSSNSAEYKLLELKARGENKIYDSKKVAVDNYTKTRVTLGTVIVTTKDSGNKVAATPSKVFTADARVIVKADSNTSLKLDVLADKSLHTTTDAEYVFAPVINVESRSNATVSTSASGIVTISGGTVDTSSDFGMDIDGNVKMGFELNSSIKLDVGANGTINVISGAANLLRINGDSGAAATSTINGTVKSVINTNI